MIASSISSPPTRIDCETTIPPSEITATSDVPPPMSTTIEPAASPPGSPPLLDARHTRRYADDDARVRPAVLVDLLDEVAQHLLGHVEVGDHAVLQRPDRLDRARRAPEHPLRLDPDRVDFASARVDRDNARLRQDNAASTHVHQRVRRAQIDGHVAAAKACQVAEDAHLLERKVRR